MQTWGLIAGIVGAVIGAAAVVVAVVVSVRGRREAANPTDVVAGRPPFQAGPDGPSLLRRLRMSGLVADATGVVTWQVRGRDAVAARTNGRGWAVSREHRRVTTTITGVTYTLVAVRLPGALPTINMLRDGVLGSNVDVESGAFNEARDIRTDDDRVAHAVLSPRVIALVQDLPEDMSVQVVGDHLISFRRGVPESTEVLQRAELLASIADAIPAFVYEPR